MTIAPQSPQAYLHLGKLRFSQKRYPEGAALLEQALQYDPNSVEALRVLVGYDLYKKQPAQGPGSLERANRKEPEEQRLL